MSSVFNPACAKATARLAAQKLLPSPGMALPTSTVRSGCSRSWRMSEARSPRNDSATKEWGSENVGSTVCPSASVRIGTAAITGRFRAPSACADGPDRAVHEVNRQDESHATNQAHESAQREQLRLVRANRAVRERGFFGHGDRRHVHRRVGVHFVLLLEHGRQLGLVRIDVALERGVVRAVAAPAQRRVPGACPTGPSIRPPAPWRQSAWDAPGRNAPRATSPAPVPRYIACSSRPVVGRWG